MAIGGTTLPAPLLFRSRKMEAIKNATFPGVYVWQTQRNLLPDFRMCQTYRDLFRYIDSERRAYRGTRISGQVYYRRNRQLRLWDRGEFVVGRGKRISPNGQRNLCYTLEGDSEIQDEGVHGRVVRFTWLYPSARQGERIHREDHHRNVELQERAQHR